MTNYVTANTSLFFRQHGKLQFTASTNISTTIAYLNGTVEIPAESASLMSTCPVDYTLWHRRLSHLNVDDVKRILRDDLVKMEALKGLRSV